MRLLRFFLVAIFCILQYKLWFGGGGVLQWKQLKHKLQQQQQANNKQTRQNDIVKNDVAQLHQDIAIEERAREELGMVKQNEEYYHFVE